MNNPPAKSFSQGGTVAVRSHKSCVVYDSGSGRIHRVHHFITLEGGRQPSDQEIGDQALSLLAELGIQGPHLKVLHFRPEMMKTRTVYAVDLKSLKLVEKPNRSGKAASSS